MTRCVFAIPGDLAAPTGGYVYARKILPLLATHLDVLVCGLPSGFPFPTEAELIEAANALEAADREETVFLIDGLAYGVLPEKMIAAIKAPIVALVHHALGLEEGLSAAQKGALLRSEAEALGKAAHIVVPSAATSQALMDLFGISRDKITIAQPGVLRGPRASGAATGEPLHVVSVGTLTPRKGFGVLADALHAVRDLHWRATIAGSLDRSPETAAAIFEKFAEYNLLDRVQFAGHLDEAAISVLYSSGDVFALASFYEGYGMVFAEAMAHGLPIVASGGGAVTDTVPPEAGFVRAPGNSQAIAAALRLLLSDQVLRRTKADAAWMHGQTLPDWPKTAETIAAVLNRHAK
jgi:glycosyltransferase involved in cell wall biosynthesis